LNSNIPSNRVIASQNKINPPNQNNQNNIPRNNIYYAPNQFKYPNPYPPSNHTQTPISNTINLQQQQQHQLNHEKSPF
jgi:hypothetical protein